VLIKTLKLIIVFNLLWQEIKHNILILHLKIVPCLMDLQKIREIQKSVVDFLILLVKKKRHW